MFINSPPHTLSMTTMSTWRVIFWSWGALHVHVALSVWSSSLIFLHFVIAPQHSVYFESPAQICVNLFCYSINTVLYAFFAMSHAVRALSCATVLLVPVRKSRLWTYINVTRPSKQSSLFYTFLVPRKAVGRKSTLCLKFGRSYLRCHELIHVLCKKMYTYVHVIISPRNTTCNCTKTLITLEVLCTCIR
jgi:hypothetical protein